MTNGPRAVVRLALCVLGVHALAAQEPEIERRRLSEPVVVDGVTCAPTGKAFAEFYESGRLAECPIAADTTIEGHAFHAGTWLRFHEEGWLLGAWLSRDTELDGHLCRGTGYKGWSVRFHEDGRLSLCFLARNTVIDSVPCLRGTFWNELRGGSKTAVTFDDVGRWRRCQASRDFTMRGIEFEKWDVVERTTLDKAREVPLRRIQPALFAATGALVNAAADIDGDEDADLFVGFGGTPNRLYRNDGGTFVEVAAVAGVDDARATRAAAFGDWDSDGDADLLVGFAPGAGGVLRLYRNEGGRFVDATARAGLNVESGAVRQLVWVDFDADGDLDLFVAFRDRPNALFRNTSGRLVDVASSVGLADPRRSVGAVWADLDRDGDLDLIVGNMDGDANGVFRNDGNRFTDVASEWGLADGGRALNQPTSGTVRPCVADVNGDGRLDIVTANYGPTGLFLSPALGGTWPNVAEPWGIAVDGRFDSCVLGDLDHDGRMDLYINGTVTQGRNWPDFLYLGSDAHFDDVTPDELSDVTADHGALFADMNGDGSADIAVTGQGPHALFANVLPAVVARRSLLVRVVDTRGRATRAGAEVRVYVAGTRTLLASGLVDAGSGYNAQSDIPVHLGLPVAGRVDIEVTWPAAGERRGTRVTRVLVATRRTVEVRAR